MNNLSEISSNISYFVGIFPYGVEILGVEIPHVPEKNLLCLDS